MVSRPSSPKTTQDVAATAPSAASDDAGSPAKATILNAYEGHDDPQRKAVSSPTSNISEDVSTAAYTSPIEINTMHTMPSSESIQPSATSYGPDGTPPPDTEEQVFETGARSSMAVCYYKAAESKLQQTKITQVNVWAEIAAHEQLAVRFAKFNTLLNLPAALFSVAITCLGAFDAKVESHLEEDCNNKVNDLEEDCNNFYYESRLPTSEDSALTSAPTPAPSEEQPTDSGHKIISWLVFSLGLLTTIFVTLSTHYNFGGLADSHRQTALALKRFDQQLERFIMCLRLGSHSAFLTDFGDGKDDNDRKKKRVMIYHKRLEELLEDYERLTKELSSIEENAPSLKGSFTGWNATPTSWICSLTCCRTPEPLTFDGTDIPLRKLHRPGMLLKCCTLHYRQKQAEKSQEEHAMTKKVEAVAPKVDIESDDIYYTVHNRSVFGQDPFSSVRHNDTFFNLDLVP